MMKRVKGMTLMITPLSRAARMNEGIMDWRYQQEIEISLTRLSNHRLTF